jgi:hypothetical protein
VDMSTEPKRLLIATLLVFATASLTGCIGRTARQTTTIKATTTGQELEDLQKALDSGLISKSEFKKKRRDILKDQGQYPRPRSTSCNNGSPVVRRR